VKEFAPRPQQSVEGYFTSDGSLALSRNGSRLALVRSPRHARRQDPDPKSGEFFDASKADLPGDITVWDTASGKELFYFEGHFTAFDLSPDGHTLAISRGSRFLVASPTRDKPRPVVVFDVDSRREKHSIADAPYVGYLFFSPDGTRLAGITYHPAPATGPRPSPRLAVWTVADGRMLFHVEAEQLSYPLPNVVWSPDGTRLLVANGWATIHRVRFNTVTTPSRFSVYNAANGQVELTVNPAERGGFSAARPVFSPDGRRG
jgi:WD40 repeat protein